MINWFFSKVKNIKANNDAKKQFYVQIRHSNLKFNNIFFQLIDNQLFDFFLR